MTPEPLTEEAVFQVARKISATDARADYLRQVCADNDDLRARVKELLRAHDEEQSFLESPAAAPFVPTINDRRVTEAPGTQIGPYKLLEQIGEGGFGIVYMAEQSTPVRRKVALKVLKLGMDTREVIARFEAERQALALMDHPHIAKVFDGGATDSGRPYFVMELVRGVPITDFCDQNHLTPRERLELFITVCRAVQHAHQKGIIHRDIKPSNVLVTLQDDKPVVKVIDFGVAKALGQELTEKTLCTSFAQMIGTPLYMSPEQAGQSSLDIDTRSDIYSLGVLLYELLTGTTPLDKQRLKEAAFGEIQRIIREEDPPRPSTRLSDLGKNGRRTPTDRLVPHAEAVPASPSSWHSANGTRSAPAAVHSSLASISAVRKMEPHKLSRLLRGELDWIVMKALEKDRTRRYATALGLASDVEHYLADEPVEACPPSAAYRFRKFASRNRSALVAISMILAALVGGVVVSTWQAVRATNAEALAESRWRDEQQARYGAEVARQETDAQRKEAVAQRDRAVENFRTARRAVDQLLTRVAEERILTTPHMDVVRKELLEDALKFYLEFVKQDGQDPEIRRETAHAWGRVGFISLHLDQRARSEHCCRESIRRFDELAAEGLLTPDDRRVLAELLTSFVWSGISDAEAINSLNQALGVIRQLIEDSPESADLKRALASSYLTLGTRMLNGNPVQAVEAEQALRQALLLIQETDDPLAFAWIHLGLGRALSTQSKPEAEHAYQEAVRVSRQLVDQPSGRVFKLLRIAGESTNALGSYLREAKRYDDAMQTLRESLTFWKELERLHPEVSHYRWGLGHCHSDLGLALSIQGKFVEAQGKFVEAEAAFRELVRLNPDNAGGHLDLGLALLHQNRPGEAEPELRKAMELNPDDPWSPRYLKWALAEQLLARARPAAEKRDWKTAAAELEDGFKLAPPDHALAWFLLALARVLSADLPGYEGLARQIAERFRGREDTHVICACLLRAEGAADSAELLGWARQAYQARQDHQDHLTVYNLGLAHYRAGEFEQAWQHIEEARTIADWFLYWPALAMTHHRLGHADAAREWLDKAEADYREYTEATAEPRKNPAWQFRAYFEALLLEARELIGGEKSQ